MIELPLIDVKGPVFKQTSPYHNRLANSIVIPSENISPCDDKNSRFYIKKGQPITADPLQIVVPRAGIEPARPIRPRDFKSLASTYSATQAVEIIFCGTRG
jgi:hypothetical protein